MNYYIYENWRANGKKAKIHKENCSHCNYGNGQNKEKSEINGRWHGPYRDFDEATSFAISMGDRDITYCGVCRPDTGY